VTVQFLCPGCETEAVLALPAPPGPWHCPTCGKDLRLFSPGGLERGEPVSRCAICGGERFFIQRDFNQRIGCIVAAIGAALSPFTYGISLLVCLALDLVLYLLVRDATLCYRCSAIYRGVVRNPRHVAFDLHTSDLDREERKYLEKGTPG
jgi:hypothetical protein